MKITALLDALNSALAEPFALAWSRDSPRFLLVFTVIYAVVVIVAVTDQKNTRPGAEHGSAAWGDVFRLNKFYAQNMPDKVAWETLQSNLFANLPQIKAERMPQDFSAVLPKLWRKRQAWDAERTKHSPYRGEER